MMRQKAVTDKQIVGTTRTRNYQLDFLKLILTIFVFLAHTTILRGENTKFSLPPTLGAVSVQCFFIMSGLFMAKSIAKLPEDNLTPGKSAITFVLRKFKGIAWQLGAALIIYICSYINYYPKNEVPVYLTGIFPELFLVNTAGVYDIRFNRPTWYLSAMLILMLPLAYLLYKKRDLTLHVLSPLVAILTLGYMYQVTNGGFISDKIMCGIVMGGMIRAACGLCFGICCYNIYVYIYRTILNKNMRIFLTIIEIILYGIFFGTWFFIWDNRAIMSVMFILPIAIAISFSEKSYVSWLFRFRWMRFFAPVSLLIYLNHEISILITSKIVPDASYKAGVCIAALFTLSACLLNALIVRVGKAIWEKKLKVIFTTPD